MPIDLEQRIAIEWEAITALDAQLDTNRTPYLKDQLRLAQHLFDDAADGLRHASKVRDVQQLGAIQRQPGGAH
jgi:hypothetical protein